MTMHVMLPQCNTYMSAAARVYQVNAVPFDAILPNFGLPLCRACSQVVSANNRHFLSKHWLT